MSSTSITATTQALVEKLAHETLQKAQQETSTNLVAHDWQQSSISSSSSLLTNSSASPSSSLTSIPNNSPTSVNLSNSQSMRSVSASFKMAQPSCCTTTSEPLEQASLNLEHQFIVNGVASKESSPLTIADSDTVEEACDPLQPSQLDASSDQRMYETVATELHAPVDTYSCEGHAQKLTLNETTRIERSNSCTQAEISDTLPQVDAVGLQATSISHENLISHLDANNELPINNFITATEVGVSARIEGRLLVQQESINIKNNAQQSQPSRFFSSKLNTGSLWSLLSVGSNNSTSMNEVSSNDNNDSISTYNRTESVDMKSSKLQIETGYSGFFSRVPFKRQQQSSNSSLDQEGTKSIHQEQVSNAGLQETVDSNVESKRFRFNVKYIGSSMLHKNFTMPMLEWISKDIKRQTVKGAQSTSQRQFTIPSRDIVLEIQSYQLMAISCRGGNCIFVHPMHCVSKYAQLQHDPTCFSYIIRDSKDSPYFCHVFQAKSANKVHDIFKAIREATTRTHISRTVAQSKPSIGSSSIQKSASTDSYSKGSFGQQQEYQQLNNPAKQITSRQQQSTLTKPLVSSSIPENHSSTAGQFENSYQFEVMFIKKVKLQCRRVPATFVDDALETLKSFEVMKGGESKAQIKGIGKRIISASVDERQEYDEACQSPTPSSNKLEKPFDNDETQRRGSNVSVYRAEPSIKEERESRSCQQSPTKTECAFTACDTRGDQNLCDMKKHQSMDSLKNIDYTIRTAREGNTPTYTNDFSPYNTITSSDLNERIAAIPVVSSSVSLDHETRQKLARQVRETIMATAANIRKDAHASGDKLDTITSSKAIDSLSCNSTSFMCSVDDKIPDNCVADTQQSNQNVDDTDTSSTDYRRSSAGPIACLQYQQQVANNFDLFRRASARQVVKNRTMLLLIGKEELCAISIDKHQILFTKSFSSLVHCLQGNNNKDHFGLICRDSGKINPNAESYAGFVFKCQSDKVVREIMGALKQVIYNSQHNYHGLNSPYNPMNVAAAVGNHQAPKMGSTSLASKQIDNCPQTKSTSGNLSIVTKRGFHNSMDINDVVRNRSGKNEVSTAPSNNHFQGNHTATNISSQPKNSIRSMFCDNCPLYWFHRLCCDIESLPAEASKAIILRRIDSSLTDKEQDEVYSRFSEFSIDSIEEHNEIFMSLLRHQSERKQIKHSQSQSHLNALAKNSLLAKQANSSSLLPNQPNTAQVDSSTKSNHQRSGSTSGSLAFVIGQSNANHASQSFVDASSAAIDNFKKAKNTISVSIENMLKRRPSIRDDQSDLETSQPSRNLPTRSGSFKTASKDARSNEQAELKNDSSSLKRSQSTSDYSYGPSQVPMANTTTWRDSFSRTINDDLTNPLVGLFRRRSSTFGSKTDDTEQQDNSCSTRASNECLKSSSSPIIDSRSPVKQPNSPNLSESRFRFNQQSACGDRSPSSVLSSAFWKKSIFDKVRQPTPADEDVHKVDAAIKNDRTEMTKSSCPINQSSQIPQNVTRKRTSEELRSLWRKAIVEQITLLKMDKQNQKLQTSNTECDIQRVKLNYMDVPYNREVLPLWDRLLKQDPRVKVDFLEVAKLVRLGILKQRRGEIWMFLMNQYQLRHGASFQPADTEYHGDANQSYRDLLSRLSSQQHEIFVDIGRTFPTHPYYSQYLSIGQLSLFNLLKAYSLLDQEVGYCQGLSFVAGILLLHVDSEDEAFELMRHLLFNFGLRKQYLPSMNALHLQLYQITRLLRDFEYEVFNHFDHYDISPSLYAAPWFLTLFASQFPLGFVARLLDLIFLIGIEAIFRVSLNLLAYHREALLACHSLESTMEYMRKDLVNVNDKNLVMIFNKSMSLDLRNKLIEYEIEYTFYCAEDKARSGRSNAHSFSGPKSSNRLKVKEDNVRMNSDQANIEESTSVADATATIIIQHLLANNHLKTLRSNYSY